MIPKYKFWKSNYSNLEAAAEGTVIPELYGEKEDISPVCIDTTIMKYMIAKRELYSIESVKCDGNTLTVMEDYTADLANAQFTIYGRPYLSAATTYFMVLKGTFGISGANYVKVGGDSGAGYGDGQLFYIDDGDVWTGQAADLCFRVYGRNYMEADEELKVEFAFSNYDTDYALRDAGSRTKIAQSFLTGADGFYVTRVVLWYAKAGVPVDNIRLSIHSNQTGTRVGGKTQSIDVSGFITSVVETQNRFNNYTKDSEVLVHAKGFKNADTSLMDNVSDIFKDVLINILGKSSGDLNAASFAALKAARTEKICVDLDKEISFNTFLDRLEAGSLFKFQANLDGELAVYYYVAGEPDGTPHFKDEDMRNFHSFRDSHSVRYKVQVQYDEDPTGQRYKVKEKTSNIAKYVYGNNDSLIIETYLKEGDVASTRATAYGSLIEYPQNKIIFDVSGYGLNLIPTQKVKITRTRADYTGGTLDGVLFRILSLQKSLSEGSTRVTAILDTQSY